MEIKHYPSPWTFMEEPDGKGETIIEHKGCAIATVRGTDDMSCIDEEDEPNIAKECIANAKLIAAAPDLLDFAKHIVNVFPFGSTISDMAVDLIKKATE